VTVKCEYAICSLLVLVRSGERCITASATDSYISCLLYWGPCIYTHRTTYLAW